MKALIQQLIETYGPSGFEDEVRALIRSHVEPLADEIRVDAMGNLFALKRGDGSGSRIMLAAHMDEIGLIVTQVEDAGFLRFSGVGTIPMKALLGTRVRFANGVTGVISHDGGAKPEIIGRDTPDLGRWFIDVGAKSRDDLTVGVGDVAVFLSPFDDLGQRVLGRGFDDRAGCAVLIETMRRLESTPHDVIFTFTVQEEVGLRGARVAAFGIEPEIGIAVDVAPVGDTPRPELPIALRLGDGPSIKVADTGMISHPKVRRALERVAQEHHIPYQLEVLPLGSTDAAAMQASRAGVMAGAVSIPTRYTHLTAEMMDMDDVAGAVRLLTAYLADPDPANGA
jgi:endoglucanase